jgi:hypothetical protein
MKIKGNWETKEIWLDGNLLSPIKSQEIVNHSPDGFNWSYSGSGCAQLSLAILLEVFDKQTALKYYQRFKDEVIALLPQSDFEKELYFTKNK